MNAAKTSCVRGHPFDAENTRYTPRGARVCRACKLARARMHYREHYERYRKGKPRKCA